MTETKKPTVSAKHNVIMESRKNLIISGVLDVASFDDGTIILKTEMGELTIRGKNLHITGFSADTGDFTMDGEVYALVYTNEQSGHGGFFGKLFR